MYWNWEVFIKNIYFLCFVFGCYFWCFIKRKLYKEENIIMFLLNVFIDDNRLRKYVKWYKLCVYKFVEVY